MKHLKIAGLCVTAMLAVGMAAAGSASALFPRQPYFEQCAETSAAGNGQYPNALCRGNPGSGANWTITYNTGRFLGFSGLWCQPVQEFPWKGFYSDPGCTMFVATGGQQYERVRHIAPFRGRSGAGTLKSKGEHGSIEIKCESDETEGAQFKEAKETREASEEAAAKEVEMKKIKFKGCKSAGKECKTEGATEQEIVTTELEGSLGDITETREVGIQLKPKGGGNFSEFTCTISGVKAKAKVTGCVIAKIAKINEMETENELEFVEKEGAQVPNKFEKGETCELTEENTVTKEKEKSAISQTAKLETEHANEIRTLPPG